MMKILLPILAFIFLLGCSSNFNKSEMRVSDSLVITSEDSFMVIYDIIKQKDTIVSILPTVKNGTIKLLDNGDTLFYIDLVDGNWVSSEEWHKYYKHIVKEMN